MASLGWFVINGVLQEFFAEGSAAVLQSTAASLSNISAAQVLAAAPRQEVIAEAASAFSVNAEPLGPPAGSASWVPGGQYAGLSADGQTVIIFDPAIGQNRFFRFDGVEIGLSALPTVEPVSGLPGPKPGAAVALPPFIGGTAGRVVFEELRNRQPGGVRFGTLPMVVFEDEGVGV